MQKVNNIKEVFHEHPFVMQIRFWAQTSKATMASIKVL